MAHFVYCNDEPVVVVDSPSLSYLTDRTPGKYICYVTAIVNGIESEPSNTVTKIVEWPKPKPPVLSLN